jgi:ribose transport system substrate-binding protein
MTKWLVAALAAGCLASAAGHAEDFHGFDPATFDGAPLPPASLKAMVVDALKVAPPRNGKTYVIGFANLQRGITFCALVEEGIKAEAKAAGVDLVVADNNLDGATALTNAESFINRNVDYVIEFQTDANFGATIMQKMKDADIKVVAIDIPMPGATFFGVNNPRAGFMGGSYLAQAAIAKFGADKVKAGYFIEGELPQSGPIPAMRTGGQVAGFIASVPGFEPSHVLKFDSKNTLEESFTQRAGDGDRDQRSGDHRHPACGQAGRPGERCRRRRPRCRRKGHAGRRAGLRRLGRLLP